MGNNGEYVKGTLTLARGLLYLHQPKVAAQENYTAVASRKARACSSDALLKNRIQGIALGGYCSGWPTTAVHKNVVTDFARRRWPVRAGEFISTRRQ